MPVCSTCNGNQSVLANGKSVRCPACNGSGRVTVLGDPNWSRRKGGA